MSKKLIAKLAVVAALSGAALLGSQGRALATGGPVTCPNPAPGQFAACRSWCLAQCTTKTCYADCIDANCVC
jgi:hypothetical protein